MAFSQQERKEIRLEFYHHTNMSPSELGQWLDSDASKDVGYKESDSDESVGHASGRRIIELKHRKKDELSEDDYRHMRKVTNYVKRHCAQRPSGDLTKSRWRYSLMNWGHDPLKEERQ
jgi:hypothetical protein